MSLGKIGQTDEVTKHSIADINDKKGDIKQSLLETVDSGPSNGSEAGEGYLLNKDGTKRRPRCDGLLEDLPEWARDNEYIKSGYRIDHIGVLEVASTICKCHNETVNVWTHLVGSIIMLTFGIRFIIYYENIGSIAQEGWTQFLTKQQSVENL